MSDNEVAPAFALLCSVFIFLMQLGFALLETGHSPRRHALNVFTKNVMDMVLNGLAFWAVGYAFARGVDAGGFIGTSNFFLKDTSASLDWFEQWVFATNASTIFGGCIAGRTKFAAYCILAAVTAGWTYPVVVHWVWHSDGWMAQLGQNGVVDFAGSGVVHLVGGMVGFIGCLVVGPRHGYFEDLAANSNLRNARKWGPHNMPMAMTGVLLLWVCWYAFNMASAAKLTTGFTQVAGRVVVTTTLSPAAATAITFWYRRATRQDYSLETVANSALAGLVAITAGCATLEPWAAVVTGCCAGIIYLLSAKLLVRFHIDDPLEAAPVHMFCGAFGLIVTGLFSTQDYVRLISRSPQSTQYGLLMGGGWEMIGTQLLAVAVLSAWTAVNSLVAFVVVKHFSLLRVDRGTELGGLDISKHNVEVYPECPSFTDVEQWRGEDAGTAGAINDQRNVDRFMSALSGHRTPADNQSPPIINGQPSNGKAPPAVTHSVNRDGSGRMINVGAEFGIASPHSRSTGQDEYTDDSDDDGSDDDGSDEHKRGADGHHVVLAVGESASDEMRHRAAHMPPASYPMQHR